LKVAVLCVEQPDTSHMWTTTEQSAHETMKIRRPWGRVTEWDIREFGEGCWPGYTHTWRANTTAVGLRRPWSEMENKLTYRAAVSTTLTKLQGAAKEDTQTRNICGICYQTRIIQREGWAKNIRSYSYSYSYGTRLFKIHWHSSKMGLWSI